MEILDKIMLYGVWPVTFICAAYMTLLGYHIIPAGVPDRGDEASLEKRLKMFRWLGPALAAGIIVRLILQWTGVF